MSSTVRPMSPAALAMKSRNIRRGGWTLVAALFIWMVSSADNTAADVGAFLGWIVFLGGIGLIGYGLWQNHKAKQFNRADSARAHRLHAALHAFCQQDPQPAYSQDDSLARVTAGRLVEMERHFDSVTTGNVAGSLQHQLGFFGQSFGVGQIFRYGDVVTSSSSWGRMHGQSHVALEISSTTHDNLLGDALFAVLEVDDAAGGFDTMRILGLSQPAVKSWIVDLAHRAADHVGGPQTHSGQAVAAWGIRLAEAFGNTDVSYATDQLAAIRARSSEDRPHLGVDGMAVGRNATLATTLSIGDHRVCQLFPHRLPSMLGSAMTSAVGEVVAPAAPPAISR